MLLLYVIHDSVGKTFEPDEDKELAALLTGYQDMVGLLHVHKVARINTQVSFKIVRKSIVCFYAPLKKNGAYWRAAGCH